MRKFFYCLLIIFSFLFTSQAIFPQQKIQASFDYSDGKIFIFYEFKGDKTHDYGIDIVLKRTSVPDFQLVPENLSGDVGEGKFADKKCKIIWELNTDEESMLEGEDFYFDITATEISAGGGIPWYIFAGGAAVAGGTAAILLLGKKDNGGTTETPISGSFPTPPFRP